MRFQHQSNDILRGGLNPLEEIKKLIDKTQKYEGERHITMVDGQQVGQRANYVGPNSRLDIRLDENDKPKKGEEPINDLDYMAYLHDLAYRDIGRMKKTLPKKEYMAMIHDADRKFIERVKSTKDAPITGLLARKAIEMKMALESQFPSFSSVFSGGKRLEDEEEVDINERSNREASSLRLSEMYKNLLFPVDRMNKKEMSGGLAPLAIALISTLGSFALDKLYNFVSDKIKKGGSLITEDDDDELKRKRVFKVLSNMPEGKAIELLHKSMKGVPSDKLFKMS